MVNPCLASRLQMEELFKFLIEIIGPPDAEQEQLGQEHNENEPTYKSMNERETTPGILPTNEGTKEQ